MENIDLREVREAIAAVDDALDHKPYMKAQFSYKYDVCWGYNFVM